MKQVARFCTLILLAWALFTACQTEPPNPTAGGPVASNRAKIEVTTDGFYRLTTADLAESGLEFDSFSADTLQLSQNGRSIPFYFADDALIFYGQAPTSRYTAVRPYLLEMGDEGVLMAETPALSGAEAAVSTAPTLSSIPLRLRLEENLLYESQARSQDDDADVWFWQNIRQGQSFPLTFDLPTAADGPGVLSLQLKGVTYNREVENDHDLDILVNGDFVGQVQFDGEGFHTVSLDLPPGTLQSGPNEILLDNSAEGAAFLDIVLLNWVELEYAAPATAVADQLWLQPIHGQVTLTGFSATPLLFDIRDPAAPVRLTGAADLTLSLTETMPVAAIGPQGFTPPAAITPLRHSDWRNPEHQADLLILTTDELAPALEPLIAARQAEGLAVALVPVAEIYDEFGGGEATPDSLQTFIRYAAETWQAPSPRYLLLVGDATTDYRNYFDLAPANIVPSPLVAVAYSGETVSDSRLADIDDDGIPDLAVGRWPVNTPAEAASLVTRTLAYEEGTAVNQALFTADATETQFAAIAETIAANSGLPAAATQFLNGPQSSELIAVLNEGVWLATYIGHGSLNQWGKDDILTQETVTSLTAETPPILVQLTCLTGLFAQPQQRSLTETMLRHQSGPVLTIAATSLTLSSQQEPFATRFIQALLDPDIQRIGDAFQAAKLSLDVNNAGLREISDTFALFGDPSARILRPEE